MIDTETQSHIDAMEESNATFIAAMHGEPARDKLIWRIGHMPIIQGETIVRQYKFADRQREAKARIDALRNPRTVCIKCGVRSDIGCRHVA